MLLQQRVRSRVPRLQSKQLVDCLLRNQLSPTDLVPEIAPRFSGPCRFFEQSLILATHHYCGGELLRHGFSFADPVCVPIWVLHFSYRIGKSRLLRILSPDDLVMGNGSQYAETNAPGFSSVFSTQMPARGTSRSESILGKPTPISLHELGAVWAEKDIWSPAWCSLCG